MHIDSTMTLARTLRLNKQALIKGKQHQDKLRMLQRYYAGRVQMDQKHDQIERGLFQSESPLEDT
jgi:hypothetical protein